MGRGSRNKGHCCFLGTEPDPSLAETVGGWHLTSFAQGFREEAWSHEGPRPGLRQPREWGKSVSEAGAVSERDTDDAGRGS